MISVCLQGDDGMDVMAMERRMGEKASRRDKGRMRGTYRAVPIPFPRMALGPTRLNLWREPRKMISVFRSSCQRRSWMKGRAG